MEHCHYINGIYPAPKGQLSAWQHALHPFIDQPTLFITQYVWSNTAEISQEIKSIIERTKTVGDYQQVIVDASIDPVDLDSLSFDLDEFAQSLGINMILFGGFQNIVLSNCKVINRNSWFIHARGTCRLTRPMSQNPIKEFSCLNRIPKDHRWIFYSLLKQSNLLNSFIFSQHSDLTLNGMVRPTILNADHPLWAQTINDSQDFPITWNYLATGDNDHSINHPAYYDAYCNIVTETDMIKSFASEKIWKPIAAGQLFLVVGPKGICQWLNDQGFYTFDSDQYDHIDDPVERIQRVKDIVQSRRGNVKTWWVENQDKIKHNQQRFFDQSYFDQYLTEFAKQVSN